MKVSVNLLPGNLTYLNKQLQIIHFEIVEGWMNLPLGIQNLITWAGVGTDPLGGIVVEIKITWKIPLDTYAITPLELHLKIPLRPKDGVNVYTEKDFRGAVLESLEKLAVDLYKNSENLKKLLS